MNIINFINDNIVKKKLGNFFISEVYIKLVALGINRYPRSCSRFQKGRRSLHTVCRKPPSNSLRIPGPTDKFDCSVGALRPGVRFSVRFRNRVMKELLGRLVDAEAHVASPSSFVQERNERIDVGAAPLAPNDRT